MRNVVHAVGSLYAWAQDRELVEHDPAARVRLPAMDATPRERVATVAEMQTLLNALELEDALPFVIATYATARCDEIRHLLVEDADLELGVIYLGADERARKSRAAQRAVPVVRPLRAIIRKSLLKRGRPAGSELLVPGRKPGGRNSGLLSFKALQDRADAVWEPRDKQGRPVPGARVGMRISPHECRHTCITWMDAAGIRQRVVSLKAAGHSLPTEGAPVTQRYTHTLPGDLEDARRLLDAFLVEQDVRATG